MAADASAGWYSDPTGRYSNRYWDGATWTNAVSRGGANEVDPGALPASLAPPAPGTAARASAAPQPSPIQVTTQGGRSGGSTFLGFVGGIVALIFGLIIVIYAINANSDDDSTPSEDPPTTEAPAEDGS